jgi:hypothetical protein
MRILEDFDKYHPIPRELGKYNYIYASGSSKNEVRRHFILPTELYQTYKEKANTIFHSRYVSERFPFYFRKKDSVNMIGVPLLRERTADKKPIYVCPQKVSSS